MIVDRLSQILLEHPEVITEEKTCRAVLEDLLQADAIRRNALWMAQVTGIVAQLRALPRSASGEDSLKLGLRLEAATGLKQEIALWAVHVWGEALARIAKGRTQAGGRAKRPKNWVIPPFEVAMVQGSDEAEADFPWPAIQGQGAVDNPFLEDECTAEERTRRHLEFFEKSVTECLSGKGISPFRIERLVDLQRRLEVSRDHAAEVFERVGAARPRARRKKNAELTVCANGRGDFKTIGEALINAVDGARVWVRPGVYREAIHLERSVELVAEGARDDVVIWAEEDNCVFMAARDARLCGFTLKTSGADMTTTVWVPEGELVLDDCLITSECGHGLVSIGAQSRPHAFLCAFTDCKSTGAIVTHKARPDFVDCYFTRNQLYGMQIDTEADPVLEHCLLIENNGIGVFVLEQGRGSFTRCDFSRHAQQGVHTQSGGNPSLWSCTLSDNGHSGMTASQDGRGTIVKCQFIRNGAQRALNTWTESGGKLNSL